MKTFNILVLTICMFLNYLSLAQEREVKIYHHYSPLSTNEDIITLFDLFQKTEKIPVKAELERIEEMVNYYVSNPESTEWYRYMSEIEIPDSLTSINLYFNPTKLKHKGAHNLGDIYFGQKKYQLAADYYNLALQYTCKSCGGRGSEVQDRIKVREMLSVCYHYLGQKDSVLATVLPVFFTNMNDGYGKTLAKVTCNYIQQFSEISLVKESIDRGLKNISHIKKRSSDTDEEKTLFSFYYNELLVEVEMFGVPDINDFRNAVIKSVFYQGLDSNCESCSIY